MNGVSREIRLVARPAGFPGEDLFEVAATPIPDPADGQLLVLRDLGIREGKSREARTLLEALEVEGNALLVVKNGEADSQPLTERAFRNLRGVRVVRAEDLNAYDVLWGNRLLFTEKAFDHVKGAL